MLEPPTGFIKSVADRDLNITMGVMQVMRASDDDFRSSDAEVDPHSIQISPMMMPMGRLDGHSTTDQLLAVELEPLHALADFLGHRFRAVHVPEYDL
jgi:hypothetical protein